LKKGFVPEHR